MCPLFRSSLIDFVVDVDLLEELLPVWLLGLSSRSMFQYIEYRADTLLKMLGLPVYFAATNPVSVFPRVVFQRYLAYGSGL